MKSLWLLRRFIAVALAGGAITACLPSLVAAEEGSLGWSDKKPESGPIVEVDGRFMIPYVEQLPGKDVSFVMIPVAGGEFLMGSPEDEPDRNEDEGRRVRVEVEPFWIGRNEVTWAEYQSFMEMYNAFKQLQALKMNRKQREGEGDADKAWELVEKNGWDGKTDDGPDVDAVTSPTPLYMADHTYMAGDQPDQPAVTMTQFAARQYTKWLSGITGQEYRLPSEAEWEYAARAGTKTAYSFGDDAADIEKYAWLMENSDYQTHTVGTKEPNPWGLYDMHGNVAEWTLDEYAAERYEKLGEGPVDAWDAVNWPQQLYPRVIRGGSWLDEASMARSAARHKSEEEEWKLSDPNLPLSPWWYTEEAAMGVGMRLVRPLKAMSEEDKKRVWEIDVEELEADVKARLDEGRGAVGIASPTLPEAVKAAEKLGEGS
jgi:formylglycine-generating enzyme required for sulfatase activity